MTWDKRCDLKWSFEKVLTPILFIDREVKMLILVALAQLELALLIVWD